MSVSKLKYYLLILVVTTSFYRVNAQVKPQSYIDIGRSNVSEGISIKNLYRSSYQYQKYSIEAGLQFNLVSNNPNTLTGFDIMGSSKFLIKNFPFEVKGFFMLNRFSDLLYETNWGVRVKTKKIEHFLFELGSNFKTYRFKSSYLKENKIDRSNAKLNENFNLMYTISIYLKPHENLWNIGLSSTNIDFYTINQSTNPFFNLQLKYKLKSNLTLYLDSWYKQAGIFNINANHFGYFFRTGIKWEI